MDHKGEEKKTVDYRALFLLCLGHMVADLNTNALPALLPFLKDALGLSYAMAGTIVLFSNLNLLGDPADIRILSGPKVAPLVPAGRVLSGRARDSPAGMGAQLPDDFDLGDR